MTLRREAAGRGTEHAALPRDEQDGATEVCVFYVWYTMSFPVAYFNAKFRPYLA
jgi:hypothetical protein